MITPKQIRANEAITKAWIDDTSTHDLEDRYVCSVLASMLACSRNPNHKNHQGPLRQSVCEEWALGERETAEAEDQDAETKRLCGAAADTLERLAEKLYA